LLAITAALAGCSPGSPVFEDAFERALMLSPEPVPPYRTLIAAALTKFKNQNDLANLEISEPRWAEHTGGPAWLVCIRFNPEANSYYYAFYFRKQALIETRFAVGTDRCSQRGFTPFDPAAPLESARPRARSEGAPPDTAPVLLSPE
jgi:hypothetical protein